MLTYFSFVRDNQNETRVALPYCPNGFLWSLISKTCFCRVFCICSSLWSGNAGMWTPLKSSGCEIRLIKSCRQMTPQTDDNKDEPREAVVTARSAGRLSWVGCIFKRLTSRFSRVFILAINSSLAWSPKFFFTFALKFKIGSFLRGVLYTWVYTFPFDEIR